MGSSRYDEGLLGFFLGQRESTGVKVVEELQCRKFGGLVECQRIEGTVDKILIILPKRFVEDTC